jgi:gliding motility-associated-like protein
MEYKILRKIILVSVVFTMLPNLGQAQLLSPESSYTGKTYYGNIDYFVFCTRNDGATNGMLRAEPSMGVNSTFLWEQYDSVAGNFIPFAGTIFSEDTLQSTIRNLSNGLYRVTINSGGNIEQQQAWVFNNWIKVTQAEIPDSSSTCEGFQLLGDYKYAPLFYYDLNTRQPHNIRNLNIPFEYKWYKEQEWEYTSLNPYVSPAIASDDPITYRLEVIDQFKCSGEESVEYISKIPESKFKADPMKGEAVLKVTFNNSSINYDSTKWFFYKDIDMIKKAIEENPNLPIDSIDFILTDNNPVYEYERTGKYLVKLVTIKINPTTGNCYDTLEFKLGEFIDVDTSLIEAPNVFTPNGDGKNDVFAVKTQSLKSMTIQIYNRWGGLVHSWNYSNIRGRDYTYQHAVWDGRVNGGRLASPGVYFYTIRAVGRDDKKIFKNGFVHLFRNKD